MNTHRPFFSTIRIDELIDPLLLEQGVKLSVMRTDLTDPITGGNKWFKLFYYLQEAKEKRVSYLASMGGPFSNHLAALAAAAEKEHLQSIAFVRGERPRILSTTLSRAEKQGMELRFVSRSFFRQLREAPLSAYQDLPEATLFIPEGGSGVQGVKGAAMLAAHVPSNTDVLFLPVGTGTTLTGLLTKLPLSCRVIGVGTVKAEGYPENEIAEKLLALRPECPPWEILHDYCGKGFGKVPGSVNDFIHRFTDLHKIPVEPIYTGRMFNAVYDLIQAGTFARGSNVLAIHTGGLQYLEKQD